jgi:hypothetical protein
MKPNKDIFIILLLFIFFTAIFYNFSIKIETDFKLFLTIATFLFAIFSGFFISRQGDRYDNIRNSLTQFDGNISFIYRAAGHFSKIQNFMATILKKHYQPIFKFKSWSYPFTHKTSTLTDIHLLWDNATQKKKLTKIQESALTQTLVALRQCQRLRKSMIALYQERVPFSQWFILSLLTLVILFSLLLIPSELEILNSMLKGTFGATLVFVLIFLKRLDHLEFFGGMIGENSAEDVLDIIKGKK